MATLKYKLQPLRPMEWLPEEIRTRLETYNAEAEAAAQLRLSADSRMEQTRREALEGTGDIDALLTAKSDAWQDMVRACLRELQLAKQQRELLTAAIEGKKTAEREAQDAIEDATKAAHEVFVGHGLAETLFAPWKEATDIPETRALAAAKQHLAEVKGCGVWNNTQLTESRRVIDQAAAVVSQHFAV